MRTGEQAFPAVIKKQATVKKVVSVGAFCCAVPQHFLEGRLNGEVC